LTATDKTAAKDTADFVTWALKTQHVIPTERVVKFLERLGTPVAEGPSTNKRGEPLAKGELVQVQSNNAPSDLKDLLEPFNLQKGTITDVEGQDIVIQIQAGPLLRVPGGTTAGKASGIFRSSQMEEQGSMKHIEIVYLPANEQKPSQVAIERLKNYIENGMARGEERSPNYFSGYISKIEISKAGDPFFRVWTQQRGGDVRSMSPNKGQVYYIGIVGKRPGGWQAELASDMGASL
jgi:hypothetical protein